MENKVRSPFCVTVAVFDDSLTPLGVAQEWLQRLDGSHPTPDLIVRPRNKTAQIPSFILEVGFSESRASLEADATLYLQNGVKSVLLLFIPDSQKKVDERLNNPAQSTLKYDMEHRLQTQTAHGVQDSGVRIHHTLPPI